MHRNNSNNSDVESLRHLRHLKFHVIPLIRRVQMEVFNLHLIHSNPGAPKISKVSTTSSTHLIENNFVRYFYFCQLLIGFFLVNLFLILPEAASNNTTTNRERMFDVFIDWKKNKVHHSKSLTSCE